MLFLHVLLSTDSNTVFRLSLDASVMYVEEFLGQIKRS